jgi:ABC-2 type transport system permease protein
VSWRRSVVSMELRKILAYRTDFWVIFLGQTLIFLLIARALWESIFRAQGVSEMNGFTLPMMTLYYLAAPVGNKILQGENMGFLSREIYDGSLTRYLLFPLSVFQYKLLTYLTHSLFYCLQLALLTLILSLLSGVSVNPVDTGLALGLFLLGSFCYLGMAMLVELLALWADNIWSLSVMLRFFASFFGGGFVPLTFFPMWGQEILRFTPFPYLLSLPIRTLLSQTSGLEIGVGALMILAWGLVFHLGVRLLWVRGQKSYSGVGI